MNLFHQFINSFIRWGFFLLLTSGNRFYTFIYSFCRDALLKTSQVIFDILLIVFFSSLNIWLHISSPVLYKNYQNLFNSHYH